ncbi:MAG: YMGG-like glycine zipper-containing protein, partial [Planctomycetota bacterium]
MKTIFKYAVICLFAMSVLFASGCDNSQKGAGIGGAAGAIAGGIIGHQSGDGGKGALIGGAIGALGGHSIGAHQDKKKLKAEKDRLEMENERLKNQLELERVKAE